MANSSEEAQETIMYAAKRYWDQMRGRPRERDTVYQWAMAKLWHVWLRLDPPGVEEALQRLRPRNVANAQGRSPFEGWPYRSLIERQIIHATAMMLQAAAKGRWEVPEETETDCWTAYCRAFPDWRAGIVPVKREPRY